MNTERKTAIVLGVIIVVIVGAVSVFLSFLDTQQNPDTAVNLDNRIQNVSKIDKSQFKKAPELTGITGYINIMPEELKQKIKGKVVLYDIWTYTCINCIRTLPYITAWDEKYSDQGLLIIGIHSPEFEFEKNIENVKMAVKKYGIKYPVVLDNDKKIWDAFDNMYWPRKYIADYEGYIRYDHIGEGAYDETEKVIQNLLKERNEALGNDISITSDLVKVNKSDLSWIRTPELYFGYKYASGRNQFGNEEGFVPNQTITYSIPKSLTLHHFYLEGAWKNLEDSMRLSSNSGSIVLPYSGKEVNIVTNGEADLQIFLDGQLINPENAGSDVNSEGLVHTTYSGLYNIVNTTQPEQHTLKIKINNPGFEIFTFTFG